MKKNELRLQFLEAAKSFLGCRESDGSHRPIIDLYNSICPLPRGYRMTYEDPWCAAFPSAVAAQCGLLDVVFPECGCGPMIELYKARGRWVEADDYIPEVGDLVMYNWQARPGEDVGEPDHVGIITAATRTKLVVLEGNISDAVGYREVPVDYQFIRGFCCPDFESANNSVSVPNTEPQPDCGYFSPAPMRLLTYGMSGPDVKSMQRLLIGLGYGCGRWADDGDFGADTLASLKDFQLASSLYPSGELDPDTFSALWR